MKKLTPSEIPGLSSTVKLLVTAGIYSMYTVKYGEASFLLVTDEGQRYFLDANGYVLPQSYSDPNLRSFIGEVVILTDHPRSTSPRSSAAMARISSLFIAS